MSNERGEWPQLLSQSFTKPLPFFLSHDTRTLPPVTPPPSLPLHRPLSPPSICHSSIRASASLGCCEREHEVCSKWHSTHTSFAVCSMYTVCKFTLEVSGCPGSFAKMCATEHIACLNVFHNTQVCECNCFQCARTISFVTHCEMCQAAIHNAT